MKSLKDYSNEELLQEVNRRDLAGCTFFKPTLHPPNKVLTIKGGEGYVSNAFLITWTTSAGHIMRDMPYGLVEKNCPHLKEEIDRRVKRVHDTGRDDG